MADALVAALLMNVCGIALLRYRLGRAWLTRPAVLLYLVSVAYQGMSQVVLAFPSAASQDQARNGIAAEFTSDAALLTSGVMLAFAVAYILTQPQRAALRFSSARIGWKLPLLACAPLVVLTYQGHGYNSSAATGPVPVSTDLAATFLILLTVAAAYGLITSYGTRWFVPVLAAQSLLLAAAGERLPVISAAIALAVMLAVSGHKPRRAHVHTAVALVVLAVLAITGARVVVGRGLFVANSGPRQRIAALGAGATAGLREAPALLTAAAARLDGDAFTGGVLQAEHVGYPLMAPGNTAESLLIAVPSAVWPTKTINTAVTNPVAAEINHFGLQDINFLPALPGLYVGFLPWPWLLLLMAFLGALAGWGERWLLRSVTPARLVMLGGAVIATVGYEQGLPGIVIALRAASVIAAAVWALGWTDARQRVLKTSQA